MLTTTATGMRPFADRDTPETSEDAVHGWYLYGITRSGRPLAAALSEVEVDPAAPVFAASLQTLDCDGLAAVVRRVVLADFSPEVLRERLTNLSELEAMARSHNRVVEAIHARHAILPAKFGSVYAHAEDIILATGSRREALLPQLHRLEGCDEWALHMYADRAAIRELVSTEDTAIQLLRDKCAAARPGRAYFLERQLREELDAATRRELATLAENAFERLECSAVAGQLNQVGATAGVDDDVEILRGAFLVARDGVRHFEATIRSIADDIEGLRWEMSGPWPPYSFAAGDEEVAR